VSPAADHPASGSRHAGSLLTTRERPIPACCYDDEYQQVFNPKAAARTAARFRRRGLPATAAALVQALQGRVDGGLVLEVGGGAGDLHVTLLEAGVAARVINVELSGGWEEAAAVLLAERGAEGAVERRVGDFVELAPSLPPAEVAVLHRVLCCYPDWKAMLEAVSLRARVVAMTIPADHWWTRAALRVGNLTLRMRKMSFRGFVHPIDGVIDLLRGKGFDLVDDRPQPIWRNLLFVRPAG
jgi:magnesium-protoporphyrin O-methyltransferase